MSSNDKNDALGALQNARDLAAVKAAHAEALEEWSRAEGELKALRSESGPTDRELTLQAKIDALMLEYCPEDMTPEQVEEWGRHQRAATPEQEVQIETARSSTGTPLPQENETYWAYQYSDGSWWTDNIFNTREQGERFATGRDRDLVEDATLVEVMIRRTDGGSAG